MSNELVRRDIRDNYKNSTANIVLNKKYLKAEAQ